jgi:adenine-specific DNA-methyltransferase
VNEDPDYLSKQLITYLGNKRALLPEIGQALDHVANRLGRRKLRILDGFSGSGVVSRLFKARAACLLSNDLEAYAATAAGCFLTNRSDIDFRQVAGATRYLNDRVDSALLQDGPRGFIEELYAPRDDEAIREGERVFYSNRNARRLDLYCRHLEDVPADIRRLCLGPLLSEASIHANTSGVFKGFHKDRSTGLGRFGGTNADALSRILGEIRLAPPVLSRFSCDVAVTQEDAQKAVENTRDLDLAYFDPPYNQHPYGSNYFMLNLIVRYVRPTEISEVSGIPADWRRSEYNVRSRALHALESLVDATRARFVLLSFNDEGFLSRGEIEALLARRGRVRVMARRYNAFRGSRNLGGRSKHVTEHLFLVER